MRELALDQKSKLEIKLEEGNILQGSMQVKLVLMLFRGTEKTM